MKEHDNVKMLGVKLFENPIFENMFNQTKYMLTTLYDKFASNKFKYFGRNQSIYFSIP